MSSCRTTWWFFEVECNARRLKKTWAVKRRCALRQLLLTLALWEVSFHWVPWVLLRCDWLCTRPLFGLPLSALWTRLSCKTVNVQHDVKVIAQPEDQIIVVTTVQERNAAKRLSRLLWLWVMCVIYGVVLPPCLRVVLFTLFCVLPVSLFLIKEDLLLFKLFISCLKEIKNRVRWDLDQISL